MSKRYKLWDSANYEFNLDSDNDEENAPKEAEGEKEKTEANKQRNEPPPEAVPSTSGADAAIECTNPSERTDQPIRNGGGWLQKGPNLLGTKKKNVASQRVWREYAESEDRKMVKIIMEKEYNYMDADGLSFWMDVEGSGRIPDRTAQSMLNRFKQHILPNLQNYPIPNDKFNAITQFHKSLKPGKDHLRRLAKHVDSTPDRRKKYSMKEDRAILNFVDSHQTDAGIFWTEAERLKVCPGRKAISMWVRYNKIKYSKSFIQSVNRPLSSDDDDIEHEVDDRLRRGARRNEPSTSKRATKARRETPDKRPIFDLSVPLSSDEDDIMVAGTPRRTQRRAADKDSSRRDVATQNQNSPRTSHPKPSNTDQRNSIRRYLNPFRIQDESDDQIPTPAVAVPERMVTENDSEETVAGVEEVQVDLTTLGKRRLDTEAASEKAAKKVRSETSVPRLTRQRSQSLLETTNFMRETVQDDQHSGKSTTVSSQERCRSDVRDLNDRVSGMDIDALDRRDLSPRVVLERCPMPVGFTSTNVPQNVLSGEKNSSSDGASNPGVSKTRSARAGSSQEKVVETISLERLSKPVSPVLSQGSSIEVSETSVQSKDKESCEPVKRLHKARATALCKESTKESESVEMPSKAQAPTLSVQSTKDVGNESDKRLPKSTASVLSKESSKDANRKPVGRRNKSQTPELSEQSTKDACGEFDKKLPKSTASVLSKESSKDANRKPVGRRDKTQPPELSEQSTKDAGGESDKNPKSIASVLSKDSFNAASDETVANVPETSISMTAKNNDEPSGKLTRERSDITEQPRKKPKIDETSIASASTISPTTRYRSAMLEQTLDESTNKGTGSSGRLTRSRSAVFDLSPKSGQGRSPKLLSSPSVAKRSTRSPGAPPEQSPKALGKKSTDKCSESTRSLPEKTHERSTRSRNAVLEQTPEASGKKRSDQLSGSPSLPLENTSERSARSRNAGESPNRSNTKRSTRLSVSPSPSKVPKRSSRSPNTVPEQLTSGCTKPDECFRSPILPSSEESSKRSRDAGREQTPNKSENESADLFAESPSPPKASKSPITVLDHPPNTPGSKRSDECFRTRRSARLRNAALEQSPSRPNTKTPDRVSVSPSTSDISQRSTKSRTVVLEQAPDKPEKERSAPHSESPLPSVTSQRSTRSRTVVLEQTPDKSEKERPSRCSVSPSTSDLSKRSTRSQISSPEQSPVKLFNVSPSKAKRFLNSLELRPKTDGEGSPKSVNSGRVTRSSSKEIGTLRKESPIKSNKRAKQLFGSQSPEKSSTREKSSTHRQTTSKETDCPLPSIGSSVNIPIILPTGNCDETIEPALNAEPMENVPDLALDANPDVGLSQVVAELAEMFAVEASGDSEPKVDASTTVSTSMAVAENTSALDECSQHKLTALSSPIKVICESTKNSKPSTSVTSVEQCSGLEERAQRKLTDTLSNVGMEASSAASTKSSMPTSPSKAVEASRATTPERSTESPSLPYSPITPPSKEKNLESAAKSSSSESEEDFFSFPMTGQQIVVEEQAPPIPQRVVASIAIQTEPEPRITDNVEVLQRMAIATIDELYAIMGQDNEDSAAATSLPSSSTSSSNEESQDEAEQELNREVARAGRVASLLQKLCFNYTKHTD